MLRRIVSLILLVWVAGFLWFAIALPQPLEDGKTDAVVVLTGGSGRIQRGLEALKKGWSRRLFVSGVDREVRPREFQAEYSVPGAMMNCCVTLGFESVDTRTNAHEVARWIERNRLRSIRLVTTDWHMRRAAMELEQQLPENVTISRDAVTSRPTLRILFLEYHKLLARAAVRAWGN